MPCAASVYMLRLDKTLPGAPTPFCLRQRVHTEHADLLYCCSSCAVQSLRTCSNARCQDFSTRHQSLCPKSELPPQVEAPVLTAGHPRGKLHPRHELVLAGKGRGYKSQKGFAMLAAPSPNKASGLSPDLQAWPLKLSLGPPANPDMLRSQNIRKKPFANMKQLNAEGWILRPF